MKFCYWRGGLTYLVLSNGGNLRCSGVRSRYGIIDNKCRMTLSRAHFLFSAFTPCQGACLMSGDANISSLACEYSTQIELKKLHEWIRHDGLKVVILFEGRDAAGVPLGPFLNA